MGFASGMFHYTGYAWKHDSALSHKNDRLCCDTFRTQHQVPSSKCLLVSGLRDRIVNNPSSLLSLHADWNATRWLSSHQKSSRWVHENPFLSVITSINIYSSLPKWYQIMQFHIFRCNVTVVMSVHVKHQRSVARLPSPQNFHWILNNTHICPSSVPKQTFSPFQLKVHGLAYLLRLSVKLPLFKIQILTVDVGDAICLLHCHILLECVYLEFQKLTF